MMFPYNKKLVSNAQTLRKNMTPEEKHLWYDFLKRLPLTVHRQHNIGNYIVDFYIAEKRIVIEIDGEQHDEPDHKAADERRDRALSELGIVVLRYTNERIRRNFELAADDILRKLELTYSDLKPIKRWK